MIGNVTRGRKISGLLYYLFGPGRANEHVDPHIVAGFRMPQSLEPRFRPDGRRDFSHLARVLTLPLAALYGRAPDLPVWHCSVRTAPTDRVLSDEEWADVAREVMRQTGLARDGDEGGCRWVAVRHAADHIHIAAVLAREDRRVPGIHNDYLKVRAACRVVEQRYGLRITASADRTGTPAPTRAEFEQATRKGWAEPPRVTLRRTVSQIAAGAGSVQEFLDLLEGEAQVLVRVRYSTQNPGEITGYAVALEGHTTPRGDPVWFSGGKLAPDLTIPQLRRRFTPPETGDGTPLTTDPDMSAGAGERRMVDEALLFQQVTEAVNTAIGELRTTTDPRIRAGLARACGDTLHLAARTLGDPGLHRAAETFDRAAREPYGRTPAPTRYSHVLRRVAQVITLNARADHRQDHAIEVVRMLASLIGLAETIAEYRQAQQSLHQAAAARAAAGELRTVHTALTAAVSPRPRPAQARPRPATAAGLAAVEFPVTARDAIRARQPVRRPNPVRPTPPRRGNGPTPPRRHSP